MVYGDGKLVLKQNNSNQKTVLLAMGGDAAHCPQDTIESFWAALGAGADAIVVSVSKTHDAVLVCSSDQHLSKIQSNHKKIIDTAYSVLKKYDMGALYQATQGHSEHHPWQMNTNKKTGKSKQDALQLPTIDQVLALFSRRTTIHFMIENKDVLELLVSTIHHFKLEDSSIIIASIELCTIISNLYPDILYSIKFDSIERYKNAYSQVIDIHAESITINFEHLKLFESEILKHQFKPIAIVIPDMIDNKVLAQFKIPQISLLTHSVLAVKNKINSLALIYHDDFTNSEINRKLWSAGYSTSNNETNISQKNGLHITIKEGDKYSGAAIVSENSIHGNFDAQVEFIATNSVQGSTFELAAIAVDPGYFNIDNENLNRKKIHLSFDVHGTPPYASSERDENDGFRCGWNNSFSLAKVAEDGNISSVNMFNKYGRDVGDASINNNVGSLRLVRCGAIFNSYYKDKYNSNWVCCGSSVVANLNSDVHIRLAAKHWPKRTNTAPGNTITFTNFRLYQP